MRSLPHRWRFATLAVVCTAFFASPCPAAEPVTGLPPLQFPQIEKYGSVVALAGPRPQLAVILHFNATTAALNDEAHAKSPAGGSNPNRELVENLLANGVEVWVCGQSVIRGGNPLADVMPGIRIAQSAMTFNINRPADGWTAIGVY
jgi:hypothetical protein